MEERKMKGNVRFLGSCWMLEALKLVVVSV